MYRNNPQTVQDLKREVAQFITTIPEDMYHRVIENFAVRLNACMNRNGGHIEHIMAPSHSKLQNHKNCDCDCYNNDINVILWEKNIPYVYFKGQGSQLQEINIY